MEQGEVSTQYLEAEEELTDSVTEAHALLSTGATSQLVDDDEGSVTHVVDYI